MSIRPAQHMPRTHRLEWWVLTAWGALALVVLVGAAAAAGVGVG